MLISKKQFDGKAVLDLEGSFTVTSVADFKNAINDLFRQGLAQVVVNFALVDFIDSSGLQALISAQLTARKANGSICLAAIDKNVEHVLQLTKLDSVFKIFSTVDKALGMELPKAVS